MLTVVLHGPRDTYHDRRDVLIEGIADVQVSKDGRAEVSLGDHAIHYHQNAGTGERFDDGIDEEQERVGPVGFDLPAQPGSGAEGT